MLFQLAAIGLLLALLPLSMVWVSGDADKYRKLVWVTLFLTFDLILFGAFTRLTDSGLGCPDWPGCFGQANPLQAHADITAAEAALPTGPVTVVKAWIEMLHRYFAMAIGVLVIALTTIAWRKRLLSRGRGIGLSPLFPTGLLIFLCLQGAFGAWTVTLKLQPVIVTLHLLLGMTLLALLAWLGARCSEHASVAPAAAPLSRPAAFAVALLTLLIALGGWVSSNYAGLACTDIPLCQGTWLPTMDFANGFTLWRDLGKTSSGDYLPFAALTAIHWTHRTFAVLVAAFVAWLALRARRVMDLRQTARWLLIAIALQLSTGIASVWLRLPLVLAVAHNGGAALLLLLLIRLNYKIHSVGIGAARRVSKLQ